MEEHHSVAVENGDLKLLCVNGSKSGSCSPVFGWSPLPERKQLEFTRKNKSNKSTDLEEPVPSNLYPNCDVSVWLRSCEKEIITPIEGETTGEIPKWIQGSLYRNGPGSLKVANMQFEHLFDSSALLHRFAIQDGRVTYQCRFLQTDVYKKNAAAKRIVVTEFGTKAVLDPCQTIFSRVSALFKPGEAASDNAMISVYPFGDELYAFTESPIIHRFNADTLSTEAKLNVADYVGIVNHTSHPHVLPDGTVYNLGMSVTKTGPAYNIICFPAKESCTEDPSMFDEAYIVGSISARWSFHPSYMHTFGITEKYFLIVEQPLSVSVSALVTNHIKNKPFAGCLRWYQDEQTCIHVMNRKTGKLEHTFYAEPFFYLHIINQYEDSDHIVIDICCYRDPAMLDCMYVDTMKNMQNMPEYAKMFRGRPLRFVLPLKPEVPMKTRSDPPPGGLGENLVQLPNTKARAFQLANGHIFVKPELLCNLGCETPRINYESNLGKQYQYFYAISSDVDSSNPGTIIKVDVLNKTRMTWCEANCYPSEPIFLAHPNAVNEDDGVIVASMIWGAEQTNRVGLLVLDAHTWQELGRAEFHTPGPVPKCLHGWFSDKHGSFPTNSLHSMHSACGD